LASATAATTANITRRPITVTAATDSKVYDGTTSSVGVPTITTGSLAAGDSAAFTQTFDTRNVGTGKTLAAAGSVTDGNSGTNYTVAFVNNTTGTITARPLTTTADAKSKVYGQADPALTYQVTSGSLVGSDSFTGNLTRVAGETVGVYAIQQGSVSAGTNYALNYVGANLAITAAHCTGLLTSSTNPALPGASVMLTVALNAVLPGSGMPTGMVQFASDGSPLGSPVVLTAGLANLTTTALSHGSHVITAEYGGNGNFVGTTNRLAPDQVIKRRRRVALIRSLPTAIRRPISLRPTWPWRIVIRTVIH
jgi:hypothetical protein